MVPLPPKVTLTEAAKMNGTTEMQEAISKMLTDLICASAIISPIVLLFSLI